jgi:hypothetical protein
MKVAAVAVGLSSISLLPRAAVFDAFETLMRRSTAILARPPGAKLASKSDRKHARALARQVPVLSPCKHVLTRAWIESESF